MTVCVVYGTRPEYLKLCVLVPALRAAGVATSVVRVHQHVAFVDDAGFYDASIEIPDGGDDRLSAIGAAVLLQLPALLVRQGATRVVVQGDTATAFYAAVVAYQRGLRVVHVEAGMRSGDLRNPHPEEGYRQMITRIAEVHACPSERERDAVLTEQAPGRAVVTGNPILDLVASYGVPVTRSPLVLITLHRRENWDAFGAYVDALAHVARGHPHLQFLWVAHPNPALRAVLDAHALPPNLTRADPVGHREMVQLLSACAFVITDSGGIQEEANFLGKHCVVLRKTTERVAIPHHKRTLVPTADALRALKATAVPRDHPPGHEYGSGDACARIVALLAAASSGAPAWSACIT